MFESMLVKPVKPEEVIWSEPLKIKLRLKGEDNVTTYDLAKGASDFLHEKIDLKVGTSKEVYKKSQDIWRDLRDHQLKKFEEELNPNKQFSLNKSTLVYLIDDYNNVYDIFDTIDDEDFNSFKDSLEKYTIDITTTNKTKKFFTDGKGGLVKLICYDKDADLPNEEYTPVVLIEFNNVKSKYEVYIGILIFSTFTFIPYNIIMFESDTLNDFIRYLDIDKALMAANENAEKLYEAFKIFKENPIEISARELIGLLKKVGYKLTLKDDDSLDEIDKLSDSENNKKIQDFFNTFIDETGETAFDILALSELRKIFRYNKLTLLDALMILSKEYLNYDGAKITAEILSDLVFTLNDKSNDRLQAESVKKEIAES